jgi:hemerythrin-like domain-containing protein
MNDFIEGLLREHRNMECLLQVLEQELSVFDHGDRPDYEVVRGVIAYFKDYPASFHHPRENLIVEKLQARDPEAAARIGNLEAEHRAGAERLRRVAEAVEGVLMDQEVLRLAVHDIIRDFINHERQHMAMEESLVFPVALDALRSADWAEVALKLADSSDPFCALGFQHKFNTLRRDILKMEAEAAAERSASAQ